MSNSGPSAATVAREVRRQQLVSRLKVENPDLSKIYERQYRTAYTIAILYVIFILLPSIGLSVEEGTWYLFLFGLGGLFVIGKLVPNGEKILNEFESSLIQNEIQNDKTMKEVKKLISEEQALVVGDQIIAHEGATIINRSKIVNSYNTIQQNDPELAQALSMLAGYIETSKNKEASEVFSDLAEEIEMNSRPSRIRAFWNELVRILPDVEQMASVAASIQKLFN